MSPAWTVRALVVVFALCSCREVAAPPLRDGPVSCERDADCHAPACGPCTAGAPITQAELMMECAVNPCTVFVGTAEDRHQLPAPGAVCSPGHVCVIQ